MDYIVLFIDGENFIHKIEDVLKRHPEGNKVDVASLDFNKIFRGPLQEYKITRRIFYAAKLHFHPETKEKSEKLLKTQRKLRNTLLHQKFEFLIAGNVRSQEISVDGKTKIIFREKGVDVKIAVDLVSMAADKLLKTAILCSSDSDLQPAVQEARKRKVEVVYLGFEIQPNKGLSYTTNRTLLFRNAEILKACGVK
ncbi:NYN domain-containing protein [Candidatus Roizmanbacteria bacterium]|nr:NYN domain-containing protein [Candidatus Roizmanbacteria bacterium]